mmetsp:Transcript_30878/g.64728  ORF Transcript_30878/g.64728 Transcript_30878/m.64728 type:complete len:204 (-) Transcript_30878:1342-1953(-)
MRPADSDPQCVADLPHSCLPDAPGQNGAASPHSGCQRGSPDSAGQAAGAARHPPRGWCPPPAPAHPHHPKPGWTPASSSPENPPPHPPVYHDAAGSDARGHSWGREPESCGKAIDAAPRSTGPAAQGWVRAGSARGGAAGSCGAGGAAGCRAFGRTTAVKALAGRFREVKADGAAAPATMSAARAGAKPPRRVGPALGQAAAA